MPDPADCRFCAIVRGETEAHAVFEDEVSLAFLDNRPLFPGHVLLIPRAHHGPVPLNFVQWPIGRDWVIGRVYADRKPIHVHIGEPYVVSADGPKISQQRMNELTDELMLRLAQSANPIRVVEDHVASPTFAP